MSVLNYLNVLIPTWLFAAGFTAFVVWFEYAVHPKQYKKTAIVLTSSATGLLVFALFGAS